MPDSVEWAERSSAVKLERMRHGNDVTMEMVRRSQQHIALSLDLLKTAVPKVWPGINRVARDPVLLNPVDRAADSSARTAPRP